MVGIKDPQDDQKQDGAWDDVYNNAVARAKLMDTVEADWDSDEGLEFVLLLSTFKGNIEQCQNWYMNIWSNLFKIDLT